MASSGSKARSDKAIIYYALAVLHYFRHHPGECLIEDIVEDFSEEDDFGTSETLLSDKYALEAAVLRLRRAQLLDSDEDEFAPPILSPTGNLEDHISSFKKGEIEIINRYIKAGQRRRVWLDSALRNLNTSIATISAKSDDVALEKSDNEDSVWEPLPLDRDTPEAIDAIEKADLALKEIEQSNGYADREPEERNAIVETIRGTIRALKTGFPSRDAIKAGLLAPLKYIAKKFADSAMGEAAKVAVAAIIRWLF